MEDKNLNKLIIECIELLNKPRYYKKNEINAIKDILNKCLSINIKIEENNVFKNITQNKIKKYIIEDRTSIDIIILDIKLKYLYLKNSISNFTLNNIDIKKTDKYKIIKDIFRILHDELYTSDEINNNKIILEIIISKVKYSDDEEFNEKKIRLEKLINKANDFYTYIKHACEKYNFKILFEYFYENNIYIKNKMYTDDLSSPENTIKCICPAILYLCENVNKDEYKVLEKALVIKDNVNDNFTRILNYGI